MKLLIWLLTCLLVVLCAESGANPQPNASVAAPEENKQTTSANPSEPSTPLQDKKAESQLTFQQGSEISEKASPTEIPPPKPETPSNPPAQPASSPATPDKQPSGPSSSESASNNPSPTTNPLSAQPNPVPTPSQPNANDKQPQPTPQQTNDILTSQSSNQPSVTSTSDSNLNHLSSASNGTDTDSNVSTFPFGIVIGSVAGSVIGVIVIFGVISYSRRRYRNSFKYKNSNNSVGSGLGFLNRFQKPKPVARPITQLRSHNHETLFLQSLNEA